MPFREALRMMTQELRESLVSLGSMEILWCCRSTPTEWRPGWRKRARWQRRKSTSWGRWVSDWLKDSVDPALRIVQQLDVQVLGGTDGPKKILEVFHVLARRRKPGSSTQWEQEKGGPMSRQSTESMSSYVSRRRAWWAALRSLDDSLKVPEAILAEQVLTNSGISYDQQLMVRTMFKASWQ